MAVQGDWVRRAISGGSDTSRCIRLATQAAVCLRGLAAGATVVASGLVLRTCLDDLACRAGILINLMWFS